MHMYICAAHGRVVALVSLVFASNILVPLFVLLGVVRVTCYESDASPPKGVKRRLYLG